MTTAIELLARLPERYTLSDTARLNACEAILDLTTAIVAAPRRPMAESLRSIHGPGPAAIWLTGESAAPAAAAFANAHAAAALDLDDGHRKARGHPGAAVIPAVFAEADRLAASGHEAPSDDLIRAVVLGYEIGLRVASSRGFYARTGFWAGVAAAAGVGVLRGLEATRLAHALAIAAETGPHMATTTAPPAWPQPLGSDVKEGIPWGVSAGLSAVALAEAGFCGPLDLIDHAPFFDRAHMLAERSGLAIAETYTKFHAACRHAHAPVEAFIDLVRTEGINPSEISEVVVHAYSGALRIANRVQPFNLVDAQYSIPYCIGLVALRGEHALLPMTDADLHQPDVEAFARKVLVRLDHECESRFPAETLVRLVIKTTRRVVSGPLVAPSGEATNRPGWPERLRKFQAATRDRLTAEDQQRFETSFESLRTFDLGPLRACLAIGL